jgi:hypothetical protein
MRYKGKVCEVVAENEVFRQRIVRIHLMALRLLDVF